MRNIRRLVLGLLLVSLSPLGWGEDVYYCVEEHSVKLNPTDSGDTYELLRYTPEKFTFKYEADAYRLAIKGRTWAGDDLFYMDCDYCGGTGSPMFHAKSDYAHFLFMGDRFNYSQTAFSSVTARTGTCTKF